MDWDHQIHFGSDGRRVEHELRPVHDFMASEQTRPPLIAAPARSQGFAGARLRKPGPRLQTLLVALVYAAYAIFLTWPLARDPTGHLSGATLTGDLAGSVANIGYLVAHHVFPFAPATLHLLNAPEGLPQPWVVNVASLPGNLLFDGLGFVFGAVAGSAVVLWLSYLLSGLSMFWLTRRLFGSSAAAALAGFAFAFYPFAADKLNGHVVYVNGWVLVLPVWRMLEAIDRPTVRNALLAGAASALAMWFTPYFILIGGVAWVTLVVVGTAMRVVRGERSAGLRTGSISAVPILVLFGGLGAVALLTGGAASGTLHTQSIHELYVYSARPLEWILPDRHNLVFGGLTSGFLTRHLHGSNFGESSLYLGLSVLALAGGGLVMVIGAFRSRGRDAARDPAIVAACAGAALAAVAAWFSLEPTVRILGLPFLTPSLIVFLFTSTWRVYARFVELLELGLCVLLAFAVARLLSRGGAGWRVALVAGLAVVLVVDLWARQPKRVISVTAPAEYVWLRDHPGGIVADYPLQRDDYPDYRPLFWQLTHHHPVLQGYASGSEDELAKLALAELREQTTAPDLAALGVRYVVVHPGMIGATPATARAGHYSVVFRGATGSVWRVGARPAATRVVPLDGFSVLEGAPGHEYHWLTGDGVLGVYARRCRRCSGTLRFTSRSQGPARTLAVTEDGRVLVRRRIPAGRDVTVTAPGVSLRWGGARLTLSTVPGPSAYDAPADGRTVSVTVREPRLARSG